MVLGMTRLGTFKTGLATLAVAAVPFALTAAPAAACSNVNPAPGFGTPTGPAVSCTTVTEQVNAGSLTLVGPATATPSPKTISSSDQTNTYTLALATGDN